MTSPANLPAAAPRDRGRAHSTISLGALILWFGLLGGLGEVALLAVAKFGLHRYLRLGPMVGWMAPLGVLFWCALAGLILLALSLRWERLRNIGPRAGLLAFVILLGWLLLWTGLHKGAALLLAAGAGVQAGRLASAHPRLLRRVVRLTTPLLAAGVLALGVGVAGWLHLRERRILAAMGVAPAGAPNVLFLVLDTVRAWDLSLYGYSRPTTPELARWARRGVSFSRAISPASWTLQSHASMFTGHWAHELSAGWTRPLDDRFPTLAEFLTANGYRTGGFVANTFFCTMESGLARGFSHYEDFLVSPGEVVHSTAIGRALVGWAWLRRTTGIYQTLGRKSAAQVNQEALRWIGRGGGHPFFAFLNYLDAHDPYLPPRPWAGRFGGTVERRNVLMNERFPMTAADYQDARNAYDESLAYLDHEVGALLDELDRRGVLRNTIVVITSDHGEEFGEHGLLDHGFSLYRASVQVPLVMFGPGVQPGGEQIPTTVSLRDLPRTLVDLTGVPGQAPFPGRSLAPLWRDPASAAGFQHDTLYQDLAFSGGRPPWFPSSKGTMQAVILDSMRYIRILGTSDEELYNFARDSAERVNLANRPEEAARLAAFRGMIRRPHPPGAAGSAETTP